MHEDEVTVTVATVRALLRDQLPEAAGLPVRKIRSSGTVNAIFRVGDSWAARFPLRPSHPGTEREVLEREARASAAFARCSPFPSPEPVAIGRPGAGYPLPWSVQTWLPGTVAEDGAAADSASFAHDLATLVTALRQVDTGGRTFERGWRGGDLRDHDAWVRTCLDRSRGLLDVPRLATLWEHFLALPRTAPDLMSHGDLTPSNVLVADGRLAGVLDCGGFGPADPALDLIAAWHLLDDARRDVFRAEVAPDPLDWERSKAWAFEQSMGAVWYYTDTNPPMAAMGRRTLARIVAHTSVD